MGRIVRAAVVLAAAPAVLALSAVVNRFDAQADCLPFRAVAGTVSESYAIRSDGTLWHFGDGAAAGTTVPSNPEPITGVDRVSTGSGHVLALRDNVVWSWGANDSGQLGDGVNGTVFFRPFPLPVTAAPPTVKIAAGSDHSLALSATGNVWSWGWGYLGRLGDGTQTTRRTPIQVPGLTGVVDVSAGDDHSVAVKSDGTVWAWGDNFFGQLGDGSHNNYRLSPVKVLRVTGAVKVTARQNATLALKSDGTVWEWGDEPNNVAPDGPEQVPGLTGIVDIASFNNSLHWIALKNDGSVWTWGTNSEGQIGDGTTNFRWAPYKVLGLPKMKAIGTGHQHTIAVDETGQMWGWGRNSSGQLGDGTTTQRNTPVRTQNLVQCFVPDTDPSPTVSPPPTPSVSPSPPVTPPDGVGEEEPIAECRFVRSQGEIVYGGYAIVTNETPPLLTSIKCTVQTSGVYAERTGTAPGPIAATAATVSAAPAEITICTYAEAHYADGRVVSTSVCRVS
jgi:alpha-tubulin suppressor-like RCC1 family protein